MSTNQFMPPYHTLTEAVTFGVLSEADHTLIHRELAEGRSVVVTGQFGTGKSVLLRALMLDLYPKDVKFIIFTKEVDDLHLRTNTDFSGMDIVEFSGSAPDLMASVKRLVTTNTVVVIDELDKAIELRVFEQMNRMAIPVLSTLPASKVDHATRRALLRAAQGIETLENGITDLEFLEISCSRTADGNYSAKVVLN